MLKYIRGSLHWKKRFQKERQCSMKTQLHSFLLKQTFYFVFDKLIFS